MRIGVLVIFGRKESPFHPLIELVFSNSRDVLSSFIIELFLVELLDMRGFIASSPAT
jgi:hypothetical protein